MKRAATYIVAVIILSSIPAMGFDGGRGVEMALREGGQALEKTLPVVQPLDNVTSCGCREVAGPIGDDEITIPNDGQGQIILSSKIIIGGTKPFIGI